MPGPRWRRLIGTSRRFVAVTAFGLLALGVYVWPARRNYYGKLRDIDVRTDVPYLSEDLDPKQRLDLYLPRARSRPFPVVIFVHGGYWEPLDRRWLQPLLGTHGNVGAAFARRGIGAAIIGYRQYPQVRRGDDSLDDVARAIGYVERSAEGWGVDPRRIVVIGHSAGGHLVSLLAMDPRILRRNGVDRDAVAGFVSVDGVFDLRAAMKYLKPDQAAILRALFGPDDASLAEHSTISYVDANPPRMLFVDSTSDEAVCLDGFRRMRTLLAIRSQFVELKGLGHNETIVRVGMDGDTLTPILADFVERTALP
jgi:pimeloyl-ACP methyl ester carboxylesterase